MPGCDARGWMRFTIRRKKRIVLPVAESVVAPPNVQCQYYRMGKTEDEFNRNRLV